MLLFQSRLSLSLCMMYLPKTSTFAIGISRKERYVKRKVDEITDKVVATLKKPYEERLKIFEDLVIELLKEKKIYDGSKINLGTILSMGANDAVKVILVKGCVIKPSEELESEDQVFVEKKKGTEEEGGEAEGESDTKKNKTLWIGELQQWMEEKYILISFYGKVESVKIIRNRRTGRSKGYGFIELATRSEAARVLRMLDGSPMPSCDQNFRLMWSSDDKRSRVRRQPDGLITRDH